MQSLAEGVVDMRINKVEELVGITKKNIRFYEEKGLLAPNRNAENGYREYSDEDVMMLRKIKLLRQLSVPIEEILKLKAGYLTLEDCMRRHTIFLDREEKNLKQKKSICTLLEESGEQFTSIDTEKYLLQMEEMEREGVKFMNVEHVDRKRTAPIMAAIVMILLMAAIIGLMIWASGADPIPLPVLIIFVTIPLIIIVGILLALKERIKQIEGGEEDAASKY